MSKHGSARSRASWTARELANRERARAAMAALDRRNPNLDDFVGLNWSCWVDRVNVLSSDGESCTPSSRPDSQHVITSASDDLFRFLVLKHTQRHKARPKQKTRWVLVQRAFVVCWQPMSTNGKNFLLILLCGENRMLKSYWKTRFVLDQRQKQQFSWKSAQFEAFTAKVTVISWQ